jgi:hypothetical protein
VFEHFASEVLYSVVTTPGVLMVDRGTTLPPVAAGAFNFR